MARTPPLTFDGGLHHLVKEDPVEHIGLPADPKKVNALLEHKAVLQMQRVTHRRSPAEHPARDGGALLLGQPLAVVNKTDGDRTHVYRPLAQPGLVGSNCAVGEPAPPATP